MARNPDITVTDNRMEWNMKRKGIKGVTLGWDMEPVLVDEDGMILPKKADMILNKEFYRDGDWPRCPITGQKLPIADDAY